MKDLTEQFLELVRLTATSLPPDVEKSIRKAYEVEEEGSAAKGALGTILKNVEMAREQSTPICQDTGTPLFYVYLYRLGADRSAQPYRRVAAAWAKPGLEAFRDRPDD